MRAREFTRQQLDPAGTAGVRILTAALIIFVLGYALVMTVVFRSEISDPAAAVLSLAVLAVSCLVLFCAASAYRAPLNRRTHYVIHVAVVVAITLEAVGEWSPNAVVTNDWGPVCLGVVIVALSPYRPARELAATGSISAIFIGFLTLVRVENLDKQAPPFAVVAVTITPLLALCFGASFFSYGLVYSITMWQRRAQIARRNVVSDLRVGIARSVQQDRVTILSRDVLPFFSEVLERETITEADRHRARGIADAIRGLMVAEVNRSWLENLIEETGGAGHRDTGASEIVVDDPERAAPAMTTDQRTALRALLVAMAEIPNFDRGDLRIRLSRDGTGCHGHLAANFGVTEHAVRSSLAPYFAVMRAVFTDFHFEFVHPTITLRFSYEQQQPEQ